MTTIKLLAHMTIEIADAGHATLTDRTPGMGIGDRYDRIELSRNEVRNLYLTLEAYQHLFLPPEEVVQVTRTT
jgi:hypothetical protein